MSLSAPEIEVIYFLAEKLTGSSQQGTFRKEVLIANVERRLKETQTGSLIKYLKYVARNPSEKDALISALTIHTTSWFREPPHLKVLENYIKKELAKSPHQTFKVWSAACSTGEEPYTFSIFLNELKSQFKNFDFSIHGSDIDVKSVEKANKAQYSGIGLFDIPEKYHKWIKASNLLLEKKSTSTEKKSRKSHDDAIITLSPEVRSRCQFFTNNLNILNAPQLLPKYDVVVCRNVLIYFDKKTVEKIIQNLLSRLKDGGLLILGHSESFHETPVNLKSLGSSSYIKMSPEMILEEKNNSNDKYKFTKIEKKSILIIDDSPTIRSVLRKALSSADYVIEESETAEDATLKVTQNKFDVITLDLNLPGENGISWLKKQRSQGLKTPIVIISESNKQEAAKVFGAFDDGAQDHFTKKQLSDNPIAVFNIIKSLSSSNKDGQLKSWQTSLKQFNSPHFSPQIIMIGAGTGGPQAIIELLANLKKPAPPIVIVQHMTTDFSDAFLKKIAEETGFLIGQVSQSQPLAENTVYTATGDYHLEVESRGKYLYLSESLAPAVNDRRPSIDSFFYSASRIPITGVAVILSGSGTDGVRGLYELAKRQNFLTMAQDELSSTVFELPKKCLELGCINIIGSPKDLAQQIGRVIRSDSDNLKKKGAA